MCARMTRRRVPACTLRPMAPGPEAIRAPFTPKASLVPTASQFTRALGCTHALGLSLRPGYPDPATVCLASE
jgi:hypothetical protein